MTSNYILRLRQLLETVRKLEPGGHSPEVEQELAELEHEVQQAATELTIRACQQEVERRGPGDRRQASRPVEADRRLTPTRRATDLANVSPTSR